MSSPNKSLMVWGILPTPLQPRGEDPETVEMGDVEIVHPGSVGDELLREVICPRGLDGSKVVSAHRTGTQPEQPLPKA